MCLKNIFTFFPLGFQSALKHNNQWASGALSPLNPQPLVDNMFAMLRIFIIWIVQDFFFNLPVASSTLFTFISMRLDDLFFIKL